jgi:hypothetical protein
MLEFLRPIAILDTWLYIILGIVALFFVRLMWLARRDRIRSIFTLERENATIRMTRAFTGFTIVLGLMLGVYYLSVVTPEIVPPLPNTPTPTPIVALPPTPTPPPLLPTPTPTSTVIPTPIPTLLFDDTPTPAPQQSSGQPPNCPNPGVRISQPGDGARVDGIVQVTGAASIDNFDYYKFEFRLPANDDWVFIDRYDNSVGSGVLGSWNSDTVPPGAYEFRLVVVDGTGNFPDPCVVRLNVE